MVSVDEGTQVAIELIEEGTVLTGELLLKILRSINEKLQESENEHLRNLSVSNDTRDGKQKIKDLLQKHNDGVMALDDNVTKEQLKDYQREFKKMGVDFSIVKNDANSFSFFFASKDLNIIEKSLKNIVERKNNELEMEEENEIVLNEENIELDEKQIEEKIENNIEKETIQDVNFTVENSLEEKINELSPKEQELFTKMNELDSLKSELSSEQIENVQSLYEEISKSNFKGKEEQLESIFNELSPEEKEYFIQINKQSINPSIDGNLDEYLGSRESLSEEQIAKVDNLYMANIHDEQSAAPQGKIHMNEVESISNNLTQQNELENAIENEAEINSPSNEQINKETDYIDITESQKENVERVTIDIDSERNEIADKYSSKEEQLESVFEQLSPEEKEYFMQLNNVNLGEHEISMLSEREQVMGSGNIDFASLVAAEEKLTNEQVSKVQHLYRVNIHGEEGETPRGSIHMFELDKVADRIDKHKAKQVEKEKSPSIFSMNGVKEIDAKLKEQEKNQDKKRTQSREAR